MKVGHRGWLRCFKRKIRILEVDRREKLKLGQYNIQRNSMRRYSFSTALITNYHKLGGLNNTNLLYSVGEMSNTGLEGLKVLIGLHSFLEALGKYLVLFLFQLLEAALIFLSWGPLPLAGQILLTLSTFLLLLFHLPNSAKKHSLLWRTHVIRPDSVRYSTIMSSC